MLLLKMFQSPETAALESDNNSPWIGKFGDGDSPQYFIFVEKQPLFSVNHLCRALFLWFSAHYIFHLQYNSKIKESVLFFQEFVFGIPCTCKKTTTYLSVSTDIQTLTMD
jgi:hypothetical protein